MVFGDSARKIVKVYSSGLFVRNDCIQIRPANRAGFKAVGSTVQNIDRIMYGNHFLKSVVVVSE